MAERTTAATIKFFVKHCSSFKTIGVLMVLFMMLAVLSDLAWVIVFRDFFDALSLDETKDVIVDILIGSLGLLFLVEMANFVGWRTAHFLSNYFQAKVISNIAQECFVYLQGHSYRFFTNSFSGGLVKKVGRLMRGFQDSMDIVFWDMAPMALKAIGIFCVLFYLSPWLGFLMLGWSIFFLGLNYLATRFKWKFDVASAEADTRVTASLSDAINNSTTVKLFSGSSYEAKRFSRDTSHWAKVSKRAWDINAYMELIQALLMLVLEFGVLFVAIKLWQADRIEVADFFLIQAYLFELFHQLWNFGRNLRDLFQKLADSDEMIKILNTPYEVKDLKRAKDLVVKRGAVRFDKVDFSYGKKKEAVFSGLSFRVKPGEKIALIGTSGGGKSTIVKLILRFFDINDGRILIDNQDIYYFKQESLRRQVVLVPQEPVLFNRTLLENIRYGRRNATDEEVFEAARLAYCHDFIEKFPEGYETFVGERGVKLSGGQRQRVAIARAILSDAKILILDEATSALDSQNEALIQEALTNLTKDKTTFVVAHRLSTIMNVDRIFVLDGGKIVEEGSHKELLKRRGGIYRKLWDLQVGGYIE